MMPNQQNQVSGQNNSFTDISCQSTIGYFTPADWLSQSDSPSDCLSQDSRPARWSLEYQGTYDGDPDELYYHNAATCPDCGQGMMRMGDQYSCSGCGG